MKRTQSIFCKKATWNNRKAFVLGNKTVRVTTLTGGGHIAEFHFVNSDGSSDVSPLWVPPWKTIEPHQYSEKKHKADYGTITEGKLLSGLVGHNICLDYFGSPSVEESKQGLSQHGEAPWSQWQQDKIVTTADKTTLKLSVKLPVANLKFNREIELRKNESVLYFKETVSNPKKADHFFHWTQHVTLGAPFLDSNNASISIPGTKSMTYPHGYDEGKALLKSNRQFRWPLAPRVKGKSADLTRPFIQKGLGFVVAVLLDTKKDISYIAAISRKLGLAIGYCFKRSDFPWVAIWEENLGISAAPWKNRTRARGIEFSSTPFPVLRRDAFLAGQLFGTPTLACVPASSSKTLHYMAFLAKVPKGFGDIRNITLAENKILMQGTNPKQTMVVKASGVERISE